MEGDLSLFQTIVIAIVEGLTEFLPVSSTGHMIITQHILGVESTDLSRLFTFIISLVQSCRWYVYTGKTFSISTIPPCQKIVLQ